jgi:hypothetical protein
LTDKDGNILYDFTDTFSPYMTDVKAVSFQDVNKDGLKDIIIILVDIYSGHDPNNIATVLYQKANGSFANDPAIDQKINSDGNNKDINSIMNYLSKKF